jgi:alcohol dehydrogenase class IV
VQSGREAGAVSVVGLGGGSPMDVAKLAAYLLGSGDELDDIWGSGQGIGAVDRVRPAGEFIDLLAEQYAAARARLCAG